MNEFDQIESLELAIRRAGNYVAPSEDLRPKTLEAARAARVQRRTNWRFGAILAAVLLVAICQATGQLPDPGKQPLVAAAINHEFADRQQTLQQSAHPGWALYEAFCELRTKQAALFKDSL